MQFGYDIGSNYDSSYFETFFAQAQSGKQNVARFWVHCDGRSSPTFNGSGSVSGLPETFIADLKDLVTLAQTYEVVIQLCLWSFDMCDTEVSSTTHVDLISSSEKTADYISNALTPLLKSLDGYSNVIIEVINEPEWCIDEVPCTTDECVTASDMQRFVAQQAVAIHAQGFKCTVGSAALKWNSDAGSAEGNYWSDEALQAQVNDTAAYLDLYNVHYYDWMYDESWGYDPCREPTFYWQLDKPTVVGELPATSDHYDAAGMIDCAFSNGFYGDMFWAYNDDGFSVDPALVPLSDFAIAHSDISSFKNLVDFIDSLPISLDDDECIDFYPYTDGYTCEQQAAWGACDEDFMQSPVCDKSCGRC